MKRASFNLIIVMAIHLLSCQKDREIYYPIEPGLEFKSIGISNVMLDETGEYLFADLILYYTDGDSNLFRNTSDTTYNCLATLYIKNNSNYELAPNSGNPRSYWIKGIEEQRHTYEQGPITVKTGTWYTGELQLKLYYLVHPFNIGDTIKYSVQVIDNDGNRSNIAEMEKIYSD